MAKGLSTSQRANHRLSKTPRRPDYSRGGKSAWKRYDIVLQAAVIILAGLFVYYPCLFGEFLWDDSINLTENPLLRDPYRLWKAWFEPGSFIEYYPITQSVQWLQWQLWTTHTLGYHLTNLALHLVSCFLIWRLLHKFKLPLAWLGGLLFAIHPAQVESVAWISELKNTLSLPPLLLAMCSYVDYEQNGRPRDYWLAWGFFVIAMLCKISVAPFPAVILLYLWWKRGKIDLADLKASAPFFAVSLALGILSILSGDWYGKGQVVLTGEVPPSSFAARAALVGLSLSFYFAKSVLPLTPLPAYPRWPVDPPALLQFLPWVVFLGLLYVLWNKRNSWGRHIIMGLGFFMIFLIPFSGVKDVSYVASAWVRDHFLYVPIIGLIGLAVAGMGDLFIRRLNPIARTCSFWIGILALLCLGFESHHYASQWKSPQALWSYTINYNPGEWSAYNNLGTIDKDDGKIDDAVALFQKAIERNPRAPGVYYNLANSYMLQNRPSEAIGQYEAALRVNSDIPDVHDKLGVTLLSVGRVPEAIEQFQQTIEEKPDYLEARYYLGMVFLKQAQIPQALAQFQEAIKSSTNDCKTFFNIGIMLTQNNHLPEAIEQFRRAIQIDPDYAEAHNDLGIVLAKSGQTAEAIGELQRAIALKPDYEMAQRNLARLQAQESNHQ